MGTTIGGAEIAIQIDLGITPFILDRDELDRLGSILTPADEALHDLTCEVIEGKWQWGAAEPAGVLTDVITGKASITLFDPERDLDPLNDASTANLTIGALARILVDGVPAFTGNLSAASYSQASLLATLELLDGLAILHGTAVSIAWTAGTTTEQGEALLDQIGWPDDKRLQLGATFTNRKAETFVGTAFEAMARLRNAELGDLWIDGSGRLIFRARSYPRPSEIRAEIGCDGAALADLTSGIARVGIINQVLVDMDPGTDRIREDAASIGTHGRRSFRSTEAELNFGAA